MYAAPFQIKLHVLMANIQIFISFFVLSDEPIAYLWCYIVNLAVCCDSFSSAQILT